MKTFKYTEKTIKNYTCIIDKFSFEKEEIVKLNHMIFNVDQISEFTGFDIDCDIQNYSKIKFLETYIYIWQWLKSNTLCKFIPKLITPISYVLIDIC